jgi:DNA-binding transcriptional regulator YiaG
MKQRFSQIAFFLGRAFHVAIYGPFTVLPLDPVSKTDLAKQIKQIFDAADDDVENPDCCEEGQEYLNHPSISDSIRLLRKGLGLTQMEFAKKLGFEQSTISKWEKAKDVPSPHALVKLSSLADRTERLFFLKCAGLPKEYLPHSPAISECRERVQ